MPIISPLTARRWHLREAHALGHSDVRSLLSDGTIALVDPTTASTPGSAASLPRHSSENSREQHLLNDDDQSSLRRRAQPVKHTSNVPLVMIREIQRLLNEFHTSPVDTAGGPGTDKPALEIPTWASCLNLLGSLTDCVTNMERIHDTPVPCACFVLEVADQKASPWPSTSSSCSSCISPRSRRRSSARSEFVRQRMQSRLTP